MMPQPFNFTEYGQKVCKLSRQLVDSRRTAKGIAGCMHLLTTAMEQDLVRFGEPKQESRVACARGCGTCCILNVSVLVPEAIAITNYVQSRFSNDALERLIRKLSRLRIKTGWLDDDERVFLREPCAFLDQQQSCMIHAVRPLLCRSITSTDPRKCMDSIAMQSLGEAPEVEMNMFQKQMVDTVYCALAKALAELELDNRPRRLTSAVLGLLTEPELVNCYISGEQIAVH